MGFCHLVLLFCSAWCALSVGSTSAQLQSSQTQVLLQLKKQLEYPRQLEIWGNGRTEFCSISSTQVYVTCQDNFVIELIILGDKPNEVGNFNGFAIPNQTLSQNFSMDSFVATLARLTNLKILRLVSLGIWGSLPDKIHRLFALEELDLSSNFLYGSIPPKISTMVNLQVLRMSDNFFNSTIPNWFNSLSNLKLLNLKDNRLKGTFSPSILSISTLTDIDMSSNQISGNLPDLPKGLIRLFLCKNAFSGEIPKNYGQLIRLQQFDVSFNALTGTAPAELFSLPNISYLNLASNMLGESLQNHLRCSRELKFVDISQNRLVGSLPSCLSTESENRVVKSNGNCLCTNVKQQHAEQYCKEAHGKKNSPRIGLLVGVVLGILVIVVLLAVGILIAYKLHCPGSLSEQRLLHKTIQDSSAAGFSSELVSNARYVSEAAKLGREDLPMSRSYSLEELQEATNNFHNSTFMGENLYGKLYRGKLESGIEVAIRRLPLSKKYPIRNFKLRLSLLAKLRHPHLVSLLGHCIDGDFGDHNDDANIFLVYECVSNGTFQTYLSGNSPGKVFNWSERLAVLISVAKAVQFLHTGMIPGFFKNRLKTNNILLNDHWIAKLSDYGLSIISEETDTARVTGESPKSWETKKFEDDVYSFGFIILEALVGPSLSAKREAIVLNVMASFNSQDGWTQVVDPVVQATCCRESLLIVISITNKCISPDSWNRPSIEDVLRNLQYASQVQATADGDQRF